MSELFRDAVDADEPLALATVIATRGSTPRHPGAHMLVDRAGKNRGTIGGGRIEAEVTRAAAAVAAGGPATRVRHHLVRDLAMCCGGAMELYLEPVGPSRAALIRALELLRARRPATLVHRLDGRPIEVVEGDAQGPALDGERFLAPLRPAERAIVFGGGHVGRALGPLLAALGYEVVLCDDGETEALAPAPAFAAAVVDSFDLADVERAIGPLGAADHAIIVTRDHAIDQKLLEQCLARPALGYLGLIGSRGKVGRFRRRLLARGVAPEAFARVLAPIGIDIGAETPAEIAVSIAAQLVAHRRGVGRALAPPPAIDAVVLAAGRGERLGGVNKALLPIEGQSFLARIAAVARAAGVGRVVVVVGPPHGEATEAEAARLGLEVARNPTPERGMGSSVAVGFAALAGSPATAALLWPVDHAAVAVETVAALRERAAVDRWITPVHGGRGGHPALVGRALWPALASAADLPGGARAVRDALDPPAVALEVADHGVLRDVDLPADLP